MPTTSSSIESTPWTDALQHTRSRSPATFEQWFASIQFDGVKGSVVFLTARDEFVRDWVRDHFLPSLLGHLEQSLNQKLKVEWTIDRDLHCPVCQPPRRHSQPPHSSVQPRQEGDESSARAASAGAVAQSNHASAGQVNIEPQARSWSSDDLSELSTEVFSGSALVPQTELLPEAGRLFSSEVPPSQSAGHGQRAERFGEHGIGYSTVSQRSPSSQRSPVSQRNPNSQPVGNFTGGTTAVPRELKRQETPSSLRAVEQIPGRVPCVIGQLNAKSTFENFIVGHSNELAYAASYSSAGGGGPHYNPLFIAGGTGLGKTHLMHAIAHKVLADNPYARVIYVSAEHFTNEFIEALQNRRMDEFRARYRTECDLLLLDDVQFLAGREQTQEEFFHTFNALHDRGVPIILTSDKYPQQLNRMPERLVSRFTSGLVADVQAPRLETRVAILKKKAQIEQIDLPDSVAVLLAQKIQSNVRELEGSLIRLAAKASLTGRPISEEWTSTEMALVTPQTEKLVCVADIQKAVCTHFRVTNAELLSKDRHKSVAFARQVAMYLCRQRLKSSFPELGRAFGNRDHTTVMSAVRKVERLRGDDPQVNAHLEAIEKNLVADA
ncbi:MAG: chromosomal replication initiator protein DnaA [Polyangiaceae bacterium]|nr:chromosomal replication initiator protein DnaA [Polyangiaceae bacterium]